MKQSKLNRAICGLAGALGLIAARPACAHDWYPHECCHNEDCAVVTQLERLPDGTLLVETQNAVGTVARSIAIRPSPDGRAHACLRQIGSDLEHRGWIVVCLFIPGVS